MGKVRMRKINTDRQNKETNVLKNWPWPMYVVNSSSSNSMYVLMRRKKLYLRLRHMRRQKTKWQKHKDET